MLFSLQLFSLYDEANRDYEIIIIIIIIIIMFSDTFMRIISVSTGSDCVKLFRYNLEGSSCRHVCVIFFIFHPHFL